MFVGRVANRNLLELGVRIEKNAADHLNVRCFDLRLGVVPANRWIDRWRHGRRFRDGPIIVVHQQIPARFQELLGAGRCERVVMADMGPVKVDEVEETVRVLSLGLSAQHSKRPAVAVKSPASIPEGPNIREAGGLQIVRKLR